MTFSTTFITLKLLLIQVAKKPKIYDYVVVCTSMNLRVGPLI